MLPHGGNTKTESSGIFSLWYNKAMNKNVLIAVIVVIAGVIGLTLVFGGGSKSIQSVALGASVEQESYKSGDTVNISVTLKNSGEGDVCLSEGALGNIKFTSFTRDGQNVETRLSESDFLTSFSEILKSRLMSVAPGGEMTFGLSSEFDPGLGAEALGATMPDGTSGLVTFYNVHKPGSYEIGLVYEYAGKPSDKCKDILSGPTNEVTVRFIVQ